MRPILFKWRGITIWSYPAMLYLGLVAGIVSGNIAAHAAGLDAFRVFVATCILTVPALIGARILHVLIHWLSYRRDLRTIWNRQEGGAAQYGGLGLALLMSVPLLAAFRLRFGAYWDIAFFTILVAMILARIGCLLNGCCAGRPSTSWLSMNLPNHAHVWRKRVPSQFLEGGLALLLMIAAIFLLRAQLFPGAVFLIGLTGYSAGRFVLEFTRELHPGMRDLNIYRRISVAIVLFSVAILAARWPR